MNLFVQARKNWRNSAAPFGNKKGQALIELATLGAVLVFCLTLLLRYGMAANQQEQTNMETFRKAFARARQYDPATAHNRGQQLSKNPAWEYENCTPPVPSNNWCNVVYSVIEDKPLLSASSGILPITERTPVGASAEAVCSLDLFSQATYDDPKDLPRIEYEINGKRYSFTTAGYYKDTFLEGSKLPRKNEDGDWENTPVTEITVGDSVDIDDDGEAETVLEKTNNIEPGKELITEGGELVAEGEELVAEGERMKEEFWRDTYQEGVAYVRRGNRMIVQGKKKLARGDALLAAGDTVMVMDYQRGEMNLAEKDGLQPEYNKDVYAGASVPKSGGREATFQRGETTANITSTEKIYAREIFKRSFKLRNGNDYEVQSEFNTNQYRKWSTPHR